MRTAEFDFDLPEGLIARYPSGKRGDERLLVVRTGTGTLEDRKVADLPDLLPADSLVVRNDTRVRHARVPVTRPDGRSAELLFLEEDSDGTWETLVRPARRIRKGQQLDLPGGRQALVVTDSHQGVLRVRPIQPIDEDYFARFGLVPIPPYLGRSAEDLDADRYQTVYARDIGSVAAPTAGLHLTDELVEQLRARGMTVADLTLHVGLGTFAPVRTDRAEDHVMHTERYRIPQDLSRLINQKSASGSGVVAVGTTVVRALEAAVQTGLAGAGDWRRTDLFITPGYEFRVVNRLFTNFHTPRSTLMMLISAFAGRELVMEAYQHAVREEYRFFSYGDACLFTP